MTRGRQFNTNWKAESFLVVGETLELGEAFSCVLTSLKSLGMGVVCGGDDLLNCDWLQTKMVALWSTTNLELNLAMAPPLVTAQQQVH